MMLARVRAFGVFWYDFIVGDDWLVALGVVTALTLTAILARQVGGGAWWWIPLVAVLLLLPMSVYRGARKEGQGHPGSGRARGRLEIHDPGDA